MLWMWSTRHDCAPEACQWRMHQRFCTPCTVRYPSLWPPTAACEDVEALLSTTGLIGFIDVIVTIEDVTQGKPAPDLFELACKRLAVQPAHSVVFEDSLIGVGAAKAAKCNVIGMTTDPVVEAEAGNIAPGFDCLDVKITGQEFYVQIKDRILK